MMKINWFSPLPPDLSDIANCTVRTLPELQKQFNVALYTATEKPDVPEAIAPISQLGKGSFDWKTLNLGDHNIYHLGNDVRFHGEILKFARKSPGIVTLHDFSLHQCILGLFMKEATGRMNYYEALYRSGGQDAVNKGRMVIEDKTLSPEDIAAEYPLSDWVLQHNTGVITHNPVMVQEITKLTHAPVLYTPLPYLSRHKLDQPLERNPRKSKFKIIFFGFISGQNRRLRPFLEAFSRFDQRDRFEIVLAGKYNEKSVDQWIGEFQIKPHVTKYGYLNNQALDDLLRESDLVVNLRWPSLGESSGTLLRVWNQSLPCLVTRTSYYSTLPEDSVAFVEPEDESSSIQHHLKSFLQNPENYYQLGLNGRRHLANEHSTERYVENLEQFLPEVERYRGCVNTAKFAERLTQNHLADHPDPQHRSHLMNHCATLLEQWT